MSQNLFRFIDFDEKYWITASLEKTLSKTQVVGGDINKWWTTDLNDADNLLIYLHYTLVEKENNSLRLQFFSDSLQLITLSSQFVKTSDFISRW